MDKKTRIRLVEWAKGVLILLLTGTAILLLTRTRLGGSFTALLPEQSGASPGRAGEWEQTSVAWPVRIAAAHWNGESLRRYGVQYDLAACDTLFQSTAGLLREALSSPGAASQVTEREWRRALTGACCVYLDLLGDIPLSVLTGWLAGEADTGTEETVRRLLLSASDGQVTLYYRDEDSGNYYARAAEVVSSEYLEQAVESLTENGAFFAFEQSAYSDLSPDTMLLSATPEPRVYTASNPLAGAAEDAQTEQALKTLLDALSFPDNSYRYSSSEGLTFRSGSDTLRLSSGGVVTYSANPGEVSRYYVSSQKRQPTVFEIAESCRQLAAGSAGTLCGDARLYLSGVRQSGEGWQIEFDYCLDGAQVQVGEAGYAALFQVTGGEITQFTIQLRTYADSGSRSIVLPEEQAAAAMTALNSWGSELLLAYRDFSVGAVTAGWIAVPNIFSTSEAFTR